MQVNVLRILGFIPCIATLAAVYFLHHIYGDPIVIRLVGGVFILGAITFCFQNEVTVVRQYSQDEPLFTVRGWAKAIVVVPFLLIGLAIIAHPEKLQWVGL
jgi:hypothetical protein